MANKKEIWKPILINGKKPSVEYMISNHGRFGVLKNDKGLFYQLADIIGSIQDKKEKVSPFFYLKK